MAAGKKTTELETISTADRRLIGGAIIEGLMAPSALVFDRLATEGGDYNQGDGGYTQSGGGNHNQNSGDYNQSASSMFDRGIVDVLTLTRIMKGGRNL